MEDNLEILTSEMLKGHYGLFYSASVLVDFDSSVVPANLAQLIPYATFWGLADDREREQLILKAPCEIRNELKQIIIKYDPFIDEWLAGAEACSSTPSDAYIAFSAMRMCADLV